MECKCGTGDISKMALDHKIKEKYVLPPQKTGAFVTIFRQRKTATALRIFQIMAAQSQCFNEFIMQIYADLSQNLQRIFIRTPFPCHP